MELLITCSQTYVMQCWRLFGFSQKSVTGPKPEFSVVPGVEFLNRRTRSHRARRKNAPHRHARERQPRTQARQTLRRTQARQRRTQFPVRGGEDVLFVHNCLRSARRAVQRGESRAFCPPAHDNVWPVCPSRASTRCLGLLDAKGSVWPFIDMYQWPVRARGPRRSCAGFRSQASSCTVTRRQPTDPGALPRWCVAPHLPARAACVCCDARGLSGPSLTSMALPASVYVNLSLLSHWHLQISGY